MRTESTRKSDREYQRRKRHLFPKWKLEETVRYQKENPEKIRAHRAVMKAVKEGILVKCPCEICGNPSAQAHHPDYTKQLYVKWLCSSHHKLEHLKSDRSKILFEKS